MLRTEALTTTTVACLSVTQGQIGVRLERRKIRGIRGLTASAETLDLPET